MVLDAVRLPAADREGDDQRGRRLEGLTRTIAVTASPAGRGPGRPKRQPQTPEEQARKEQILTNPGKGILAELRERKETIHVAAE
jgi:hypothetical protein